MLARLQLDWTLFTIHALLPDEAAWLVRSFTGVFVVLGLLLAAVWLQRMFAGDDDWIARLAGYSALLCAALTIESLMFAPLTTSLLMGPPHPIVWVRQAYPTDCLWSAIGAPLIHGLLLYGFRWQIADWFRRALTPRAW